MTFDQLMSYVDIIDGVLDRILFRLRHGDAVGITAHRNVANGAQFEHELWIRGVTIGGRRIAGNKGELWGFDVRKGQEKWAKYIINCMETGKPLPKPWSERKRNDRKGTRFISR